VNSGHRDFVFATRHRALQLRYLVRLYVKELVLKNFAGLPADQLLERMIGRVGRSISTPASRRTVRETLTSYSSHQANMPVTPSFQCTNSLRLLTAMTSINRPARIFAPL
jgi:hypothetical protein